MQPCSGEMQGMNSLLNSSEISLQELQGNQQHSQIQNPQIQVQNPQLDPASHDDFLEQMLSAIPSCSWADLNPKAAVPSPWELAAPNAISAAKPRDLSDETPHPNPENVHFHYDDQSAILASKLRQHQISGASAPSAAAAAAAKMMLQQQFLMTRGVHGTPDAGILSLPLSLNGTDFDRHHNDDVVGSSFKPPTQGADGSVQALYNGFAGSLHGAAHAPTQTQHFQHPQGGQMQAQSYGAAGGTMGTQSHSQASGGCSASTGNQQQPKQRVRARRGQATDPHSIAERLRRERIAERMKALQELVPNANKTDKASMLDEIIDYVKFLQLQVKVLSMSRLGGAAAVAPLVADMSSEGGGDRVNQASANGGPHLGRGSNGDQSASPSSDSLTVAEHQVAKLMEEDMGQAMQYLQGKGLCLMPISLATAISTATCHSRTPVFGASASAPTAGAAPAPGPLLQSNAEGPSSPSMSVLTVQSATVGNSAADASARDAASVSKP